MDHARAQPLIRLVHRSEVRSLGQSEHEVVASVADLNTGENIEISCRYLVGCDGGKSHVRKAIGAKLVGTAHVQNVQSTCIKAPDLLRLLPSRRAWLYAALNPRRCGSMIAVDGGETWLIHNFLYRGEEGFDAVDRDWAIRQVLGVDEDFTYEVLSKENWTARRLVADRFRDRRVFICGDAAHLWIPHAGYGMNAGIADGADLSWMLGAVLKGWAAPGLADAYEAERQPITEQVSHFTTDYAHKLMRLRREVPPEIEADGPEGDTVRERLGRITYEVDVEQQCCAGLNFGYFYDRSPIVAYDGEQHPPYTMGSFASSTVPGCRLPHFWLAPNHSVYDALGSDYALMRLDPTIEVDRLARAAAHRQVPLAVLDATPPSTSNLYRTRLLLVRPDLHIAWRGNEVPAEPLALIDLVRGASSQFKSCRNTQ